MNRRSSATESLALWSAARGRNALRRVRLMYTVALLAGVGAFVVLRMLPRDADRALRARIAALTPPIDTASLLRLVVEARDSVRGLQEQLAAMQTQRGQDSMFAVSVTDAAGVPRVVVGDTLRAQLAEQLRLARATPIVEGFLALAETPALASDTIARQLADSLRDAERERGDFSALGGPDLRYRALQDRVTSLGERLVERAMLRLQDDPMFEPAPETLSDTAAVAISRRLRAATDSVNQLETDLRAASEWNARRDEQERQLRAAEPIQVPVLPMLLAVVTIAASAGYLAAFAVEWRRPRVADSAEVSTIVERAGVDLTVVMQERPSARSPQRRAVDRTLPTVLRRDTGAYEQLQQQLNTIGDAVTVVGIISDEADDCAAVAVRLAAAAAEASRAVLLIDADVIQRRVARTLGRSDDVGLTDAVRGRVELASALVTVNTGRDHSITLLPAGSIATPHAALDAIAPELHRLMQRHDMSVIALATEASSWPAQLAPRDVVIAVAPGRTHLDWLAEALRSATLEGQRVRGVLLMPRG